MTCSLEERSLGVLLVLPPSPVKPHTSTTVSTGRSPIRSWGSEAVVLSSMHLDNPKTTVKTTVQPALSHNRDIRRRLCVPAPSSAPTLRVLFTSARRQALFPVPIKVHLVCENKNHNIATMHTFSAMSIAVDGLFGAGGARATNRPLATPPLTPAPRAHALGISSNRKVSPEIVDGRLLSPLPTMFGCEVCSRQHIPFRHFAEGPVGAAGVISITMQTCIEIWWGI